MPSYSRIVLLVALVAICFVYSIYPQNSQKGCPKLKIIGPATLLLDGQDFEFSLVAVDGTNIDNAKVKWTVSTGRITKGNGTLRATFSSARNNAGTNVTIYADVKTLPNGCSALLSDVFAVVPRLPIESMDEWGKVSSATLRAHMDMLFSSLNANPKVEGILVMHFSDRDTRNYKLSRVKLILDQLRFRRYDPKRLSFYFDTPHGNERTIVWGVFPEFDLREIGIDASKLIKAEEISGKTKTLFRE